MPASVVKSFAKKSGKSVEEVEKIWDKLKDEYGEDYARITGTLKKILKLNESKTFTDYISSLSEGKMTDKDELQSAIDNYSK